MLARVTALAVLAASLAVAPAAAQDFPADPAGLSADSSARSWRVPLGVGLSYGVPGGSINKAYSLSDAFGGGPTLRLDAGLAYEVVGASFVWRRGFVAAGRRWCPTGSSCTARFDAVGGGLSISPGSSEAFAPFLMIGGAVDEGEVKWSGGYQRVTGWEMFVSLFMGPRLGDASSPWKVGGYLDFRIMTLDHLQSASGKKTIPLEEQGTPIWFELGVRAAFD